VKTPEILAIFKEHLNTLKNKNKYREGIEDDDQEKALYALNLALDDPSLSSATLCRNLANERQPE
jgi:hypothetical protein